jgi:hypothetical protein
VIREFARSPKIAIGKIQIKENIADSAEKKADTNI